MHLLKYFDKLSLKPENAKELKVLILDLAIRGRLTKEWRRENRNVEVASDLLKRSIKAKEQLTKENIIKKGSKIKEDLKSPLLYSLPKSWAKCTLDEVCQINPKNNISDNLEVGFVPMKLVNKTINIAPDYENRKWSNVKKGYTHFQNNDIAFAKITPCFQNSKAGVFKGLPNKHGAGTTELFILRPFIPELEPYHFLFIFKSIDFLNRGESKMTGSAGQKRVPKDFVRGFSIGLPPLAEQKAIVKIVNQLMDEVDQIEAQTKTRVQLRHDFIKSSLRQLTTADSPSEWSKLKPQFTSFFDTSESIDKLKEAILQLAVQGKLTKQWRMDNPNVEPASVLLEKIKKEKAQLVKEKKIKKEKPLSEIAKEEIPFELPEGWKWIRLQELTEVITKGSSPKWQGVEYVAEENGILFITSENVGNYHLIMKKRKFVEPKFNEIEPRSILKKNDILMNIVGGSIGRTAIFHLNDIANINQAVTIIRLLSNNNHNYFLHFFNSPLCVSYMYNKQVDNARPNLSMGNISKFLIPLPPLEEQKAITNTVNKLMDYCDQMKSEIENRNSLSKDFLRSSIREVMEKTKSLA